MLVIVLLDTARNMTVFESSDTFGVVLLLKLAMVTARLLSCVSQIACFVASQTGNLERVLLDARLSKSDLIRYGRLAVVHAVLCWIFATGEMLMLTVALFLVEEAWEMSVTPLGVHVFLSDQQLLLTILRLTVGLVYLVVYSAWIFTLSLNYIVYFPVLQCTASRATGGTLLQCSVFQLAFRPLQTKSRPTSL